MTGASRCPLFSLPCPQGPSMPLLFPLSLSQTRVTPLSQKVRFVDFEDACVGPRLFDLAVAAVGSAYRARCHTATAPKAIQKVSPTEAVVAAGNGGDGATSCNGDVSSHGSSDGGGDSASGGGDVLDLSLLRSLFEGYATAAVPPVSRAEIAVRRAPQSPPHCSCSPPSPLPRSP